MQKLRYLYFQQTQISALNHKLRTMKWIVKIIICCTILNAPSIYGQKDSLSTNISKIFFKKLVDKGGTWTSQNENFDANNKDDFSHFVMEFKTDEFGALNGTISGINSEKHKVFFWKVLEFANPHTGEIIFVQHGNWGYTLASSSFKEKDIRKSEFELNFYNGAKEKHRDVHTFLDDNTMYTESETFDTKSKKWIKQPAQKWVRK